jgi:Ca-activated chloride channel family protein
MRPLRLLLCILATALPARALQTLDIGSLKGPGCVVVDSARKAQIPLAPFFTRVNVVVGDGLAQATMIQSFANPLPHSTEVAYVFPLPEKGAVHAMAFQVHDTLYRATVQEKARAQAIYDSIRSNGGQAALLLQERPNVFQQKMANIRAGDTVHVEIKVSIPLKYADGSWELAFPTMVGERYQSAGAGGVSGTITGWNPPEDRDGPGFFFNVLVKDASFDSIGSPTHPVELLDAAKSRRELSLMGLVDSLAPLEGAWGKGLKLRPVATYPNRDFVLRLHRAARGIDALATSWKPAGKDTGYFHLAILPDLAADSQARPPLDLVLLVDRSGSQSGWPMDREKQIAKDLLGRLTPQDRFTLLAFDNAYEYALGSSPVPASEANIAKARTFVDGLYASGGTELLSAIQAALATPLTGDMQRLFVFLTDGFITNEAAILDAIRGHTPQPQVLTFGCGNSLNRYFLEEAATSGGGFATLLTEAEAEAPAVEVAWARIEAPQVNALRLDFGGMGAHDVILPPVDRLYAGLPLVVDGKYLVGGKQTITLRGQRAGAAWTLAREIDLAEASGMAWAVPKTWARATIGRLERAEGASSSNKDSIVAVSVAHQVLSKYTAFLATVGTPVESDASLKNAWTSSQALEVTPRQTRISRLAGLQVLREGGLIRILWGEGRQVSSVRILSVSGAVVRTLQPASGRSEATWDGMGAGGVRARPGTYVVEAIVDGIPQRVRVVWMP